MQSQRLINVTIFTDHTCAGSEIPHLLREDQAFRNIKGGYKHGQHKYGTGTFWSVVKAHTRPLTADGRTGRDDPRTRPARAAETRAARLSKHTLFNRR